jgi:hypothetical protein
MSRDANNLARSSQQSKPQSGKKPEPPPFPDDSELLERQEAQRELHRRMRMIIGYAEIVQINLDMWDIIGAKHAYAKLRGHMIDCSSFEKKI